MKTLTELSGSVIRVAAAAIADAKRSLPSEQKPAAPPAAEAAPQEPGSAVGAPCQTADEPRDCTEAPVARDGQADSESDAVNAALDQAIANATGFTGDRLAMLRAAVEAAEERAQDVRLIRVFGLEEPLSGARVIGQHQYVVDFFPRDMKQTVTAPKDERGRGGGGGRRGGGAGAGGRGGKGSATGGFSMDSLRDDRKNERGRGRDGGGRRPSGGGAGGRGAPARPAGGDPKK